MSKPTGPTGTLARILYTVQRDLEAEQAIVDMQARQIEQLEARLAERPVCRCWWCRMMRTIGGWCR
jgi:hypothetical protein